MPNRRLDPKKGQANLSITHQELCLRIDCAQWLGEIKARLPSRPDGLYMQKKRLQFDTASCFQMHRIVHYINLRVEEEGVNYIDFETGTFPTSEMFT